MVWIVVLLLFIDLWMLRIKVSKLKNVLDDSLSVLETGLKKTVSKRKSSFQERLKEMKEKHKNK